MKVLLHVSDLNQIKRMQNNINNLLKEDETISISVFANDMAIKSFVKSEDTIINDKVHYYICSNSMRSYNVNADDLLVGTEATSSGVYKILLLQEVGYHYIKV